MPNIFAENLSETDLRILFEMNTGSPKVETALQRWGGTVESAISQLSDMIQKKELSAFAVSLLQQLS
mgnify:CR=1 FL=1